MSTETSAIFAGTGSDVKVKVKRSRDDNHSKDVVPKKRNRLDYLDFGE